MKRYDYLGETFGIVLTAVQTQELFQIISLILTCISVLVSLCFTIYNWYKTATNDNKITNEEVNELKESIKEHIDKIKERKE